MRTDQPACHQTIVHLHLLFMLLLLFYCVHKAWCRMAVGLGRLCTPLRARAAAAALFLTVPALCWAWIPASAV